MTYWLKIAAILLAVWAFAAGAIYWARAAKPTAASVSTYIRSHDLSVKGASERTKVIAHVEGMLNRTPFEERQRLQREGITREFFRSLTPGEQEQFLDATLPAGFKQMMDSFNAMEPARRKQLVDRALAEMKKHEGEQPPPGVDDRTAQRVIDQGLRSFYRDANADVKLDLSPMIEQMQKNMQSGR